MPVPAGIGWPGSIEGRPRPAWAIPARSSWARLKSLQEQAFAIGRLLQLTCRSGEVAISIRSAFWRIARYGLRCHLATERPLKQFCAYAAIAASDSAERPGRPQ